MIEKYNNTGMFPVDTSIRLACDLWCKLGAIIFCTEREVYVELPAEQQSGLCSSQKANPGGKEPHLEKDFLML